MKHNFTKQKSLGPKKWVESIATNGRSFKEVISHVGTGNESDDELELPQTSNEAIAISGYEHLSKESENNRVFPEQIVQSIPQAVPFLGTPRKGRSVSVALPASIIANAQSNELKAYLVGQIARTLVVFGIDEVVIFEDSSLAVNQGCPSSIDEILSVYQDPRESLHDKKEKGELIATVSDSETPDVVQNNEEIEEEEKMHQSVAELDDDDETLSEPVDESDLPGDIESLDDRKWSQSLLYFIRNLAYLETPQYLRKALFKMHPSLRMAGLQNPLDAPHHMRATEWLPYRDGVVISQKSNRRRRNFKERISYSTVDCGLVLPVRVSGVFSINSRVTVRLDPSAKTLCQYKQKFDKESRKKKKWEKGSSWSDGNGFEPENSYIKGDVVPRREPVDEFGLYWGYQVRAARSLKEAISDCPFTSTGYDLIVGTSERGDLVDPSCFQLVKPEFKHCLIVFGGLGGLEESIEDEQSEASSKEEIDTEQLTKNFLMFLDASHRSKVAVNGCCHGALDMLYETVYEQDVATGQKTDILLCCGDFQAIRNEEDLLCLSCPEKYRRMGDFQKYLNGTTTAPILTIFIGGNHEASNVLRELYYGGWVAPNIFYLGQSGVVRIGSSSSSIRLAGVSGILKSSDYNRGYFEMPPYDEESIRSSFHIREFEINKLLQIRQPLDIMITHDWPQGIEKYGDVERLLSLKPYLANDVRSSSLGNSETEQLLSVLKPKFWFAGHLHVQHAALFPHPDGNFTRFLATDKPLRGRHFLHFLDIPVTNVNEVETLSISLDMPKIFFDVEWLAILKENNARIPIGRYPVDVVVRSPSDKTIAEVSERLMSFKDNEVASALVTSRKEVEWEISANFIDLSKQREQFLCMLGEEDTLYRGLYQLRFNAPKRAGWPVKRLTELQANQLKPSARVNVEGTADISPKENERYCESNLFMDEELDIDI